MYGELINTNTYNPLHVVAMYCIWNIGSYRLVYNFPVSWHSGRHRNYGNSIIQYLTLLSLHTITLLPLTTVYFVNEVHCTSNVLHSTTP